MKKSIETYEGKKVLVECRKIPDLFIVCYEPEFSEILMREKGSCPNSRLLFTIESRARQYLEVCKEYGKMAFLATCMEVNGQIVPDEILEEV